MSARACPFAHHTRLALGEKGLDFELIEVDLQNKPTWFSEVSVYGKVPALEHAGQRFVESAIIVAGRAATSKRRNRESADSLPLVLFEGH